MAFRHGVCPLNGNLPEENAMKRQCAWCGQILGQSIPYDNAVTHTICPKCSKEMLTLANSGSNARREHDDVIATKDESLAVEGSRPKNHPRAENASN
jgi:predicted RNA-binding Zn-ribbon protein involved in translation (DUF1610 family)